MTVLLHPRADDLLTAEELSPWRQVPAAVAADLVPDEQLDPRIRPLNPPGKQPKLFGCAVTALCEPPDFGAVLHAIEQVGPGEVLVIAAGGDDVTAMIGEILGGHLRSRGCAGVVCDGAVRDVALLASWPDFSVFTRFVTPRGPTGGVHGAVNAPVSIGARVVNPGDLIIGDDDGLVALTPATVRARIGDAEAKLTLEAQWTDALANGRSIAQTFGLSPAESGK